MRTPETVKPFEAYLGGWTSRSDWDWLRPPFIRLVARRLAAAIIVSIVLVLAIPWFFVQQPRTLSSDADFIVQPGRPSRPMSSAERDAIRAVLDHRACVGGASVAELLETRRSPGATSWPTASYAIESDAYPETFSVYVPYRVSGAPDLTELTYVFWYYAQTRTVGGGLIIAGTPSYRSTHPMDLADLLGATCPT